MPFGGCTARQPDAFEESGSQSRTDGGPNETKAEGSADPNGAGDEAAKASGSKEAGDRSDSGGETVTMLTADGETIPAPMPRGVNGVALRVWNDPEFQRQFAESYKAETDIEPKVTADELEKLEKVLQLIGQEQFGEAKEILNKNIGEATTAVFEFTAGNIHFQLEEWDKAVEMYRAAVDQFPNYRRAWDNMGKIHIRLEQFPDAVKALTRVIELGGGDGVTYGLLGFAYTKLDKNISAESAYRQAVLMDAETKDWKLGLARSFFKQNRYAEAAAYLDRLIELEPDRADFWLLQANAYIGLEEVGKAAENYEMLRALGEATPASLNTLGDIYVNEKLYDRAVEAYVEAMEKTGKREKPDRAIRAARVLAARGALDQTETLVKKIDAIYGDSLDEGTNKTLLKLRARIAVAQGASGRQVEILKELVKIDPRDGEALMLLAKHHAGEGEVERAVFYYERAAKIEGFEANARVRHAQLLVREGRFKEAVPLLRKAQEIDPRNNVQRYLDQVERIAKSR